MNFTYKSKTYSDPSNDPQFEQEKFSLINANVSFGKPDDSFRIGLFARNLTDEKYVEAATATALNYNFITYNEPRVVGIEFSMSR